LGGDVPLKVYNSLPASLPIGTYVDAISYTFHNGSFSGGYGGKKWGIVTDCLANFVHGIYSAEMMLDVGFTLAHNGGPIFNKGMCYTMYDGSQLIKILDVQNVGMTPQLVSNPSGSGVGIPPHIQGIHESAVKILGDEMTGSVDWNLVKAEGKGSTHKYTAHKMEAAEDPIVAAKKAEEAKKKQLADQKAVAKAKAEEAAKWYWVGPNEKVEKTKRTK
jgi:hypothetical protein